MKSSLPVKSLMAAMFALMMLVSGRANASHAMGADLTYQCLGGNTYQITLSFYRDCIGIAAPGSPFVTISSASCGQSLGVTCYRRAGTGQEVTPACSSSVTTCNGGSFTGIQEYVYDGIITLPMQCADWIFGYSLCCRNAAITTINLPSSNTFYIDAMLNNLVTPCNSSPTFSNKPVPFLCLGQSYCFNHGAYDVDGDSLVYSLIDPMQTFSNPVIYHAPYNAANPLNSSPATSFNTATGDICLNPQALEVTVMAVLVQEYRNGVLIGSVERDLQLTVMNCANNLPSLTGINGTNNFSITVCANQQTCFDIFSLDPDAGQQLTVTWDNSIPGGTFSTGSGLHPTGTFCWTPTSADIGRSFTFTVRVIDDACPYYGSQIFSYTINVVGISVSAGPDQDIACSDLATVIAHASGGSGTYTYLWSTGSTMQAITIGAGTYWVTANDGSCSATDTVVINTPYQPTALFTHTNAVCLNNPIHFTDHSTTNGGILVSWDWNFGDGSTSTQQNPTHQFAGPGTYDITLIVLNNLGCIDTLTQQIVIDPPPVSQFTASNSCVNSSVLFTDQTSGTVNTWSWNFGDGSTSTAHNPTHTYATAGTYNVTLISGDTLGCIDTIVHPITIFPLPTASAGADQTVCAGNSVTLTASGGSTYTWHPSGSTGSTVVISPSGTTTVSVTVTDANGCSATDTVNVIVNPLPTISAGADLFICNGSGVTLSASGGVSYIWNPGAHAGATYVVNPGSTTTYTVTGTGVNGCTSTDAVVVSVGSLPIANAGPDVNICSGSNATLTASGGNTYMWNPIGSTTSTITVSPGSTTSYTVIVTDPAGCTASDVVNVTVHANPTVNLQSTFLCAGSTTTLNAGNPGATYVWSTGQTTQSIIVSSGGNFNVTVTDAFGCVSASACTITYGSSMTINLGNVSFCQGDSVTLDAGWAGMSHVWTPGGQTSQTITIHSAGNYGVIVTDTSGCSGSINVTAIMNNLPIVNFSSSSVCIGDPTVFTDGSSVTGGSVASWAWNFGDGAISTAQSPTHTYSSAGTYTVTLTVTSANGCVNSTSHSVIVNPLPVAQFTFANGCQGSAISFTDQSSVSVGMISSYNWNFNDGTTSTAHNPTHTFNAAGNYNVTLSITTAGGCSQMISHQVVVHPLPVADFSTNPVCLGNSVHFNNNSSISTGSISSSHWDFNDTYSSNQNNPNHTYASAGTYNVTLIVNSGFGCTDTINHSVTVNPLPVASAGADQTVCRGTTVSLSANGGSAYNWMPGNLSSATISVNPTSSHSYTVTVTDANGCTATDAVNVTVNQLPTASAGADQSICVGNGASLNATGGVSYNWTPGNLITASINVNPALSTTYTVTVTDAQGCTSTDAVGVTVNSLPIVAAGPDQTICYGSTVNITASGATNYQWNPIGSSNASVLVTPTVNTTYTVVGTDVNGCVSADTISVIVNPVPVVSLYPTFVCAGSSTTLDAGNTGCDFSWSTGETAQSIAVVDSGNYSVIVTSPNGCSVLGSTHVTLGGNISITPTSTSVCAGQTATLNAGNPGCTYSWSNGSTAQSITVNTTGTYFVTITDINGCAATMNHQVTVNPIPVPSFSVTQACLGSATAFTNTSTIASGTISSVIWNFGDSFTSSATNASHIYAYSGTYYATISVTSAAGCSAYISAPAQVNPNPVAAFSTTPVCLGNSSGFVDHSSVSAGSITEWNWNFGDNSNDFTGNPSHIYGTPGTYTTTLIVTTNHNCSDTISQSNVVNGLPDPAFSAVNGCANSTIQFANASSSSYGSIASYQWNFGNGSTSNQVNPSLQFANDGLYNVSLTVLSSLGCQASISNPVTVYPLPLAAFAPTSACAGTSIGISNNTTVSSGAIQNYYWAFGDNTTSGSNQPVHSYLNEGSYAITLIATSDHGCLDTATQNVSVFPLPQVMFTTMDTCQGNAISFVNNSNVNNGNITSWSWDFNDGNSGSSAQPSHLYATAGSYNVVLTATTDNGCTASSTEALNIYPNPVAAFSASNVCFGGSNQLINQSTVDGGITFISTWNFNDGTNSTQTNPSHNFQTAGNYPVTLTVVTSNGCTDQISNNVAVYNPPVARFAANDACVGLSTQFVDQSSSIDGSIIGWNWEFGDNYTSVESSPSHLYSTPGTYGVSLVVTTAYGCWDSYSQPVQIYSQPSTQILASNVCEDSPVQFVSVSSSPGLVNYVWNLGNGITSTDSTFSYTYSDPGTYNISVVATNSSGCSATQTARLDIYPKPTLNFNVSEVCQNSASQFINTSSIQSGSVSIYGWTFGDNSTSTQASPSHVYQYPGTYPVTLTAVSDNGCVNTMNSNALVNPNPVVAFQGSTSGCGPLFSSFSETATIASGSIVGYLWDFGDGEVSTDMHPIHTFTEHGSYNVSLTAVSDRGCYASYVGNNNVVVYPQPTADFTADPITTDIISPVIHFDNQSSNYIAYQWVFSDGFTTNTELNPVHAFADTGVYTALLITTNSYGCVDSVMKSIEVRPKSTLFVPNCFTPNNDGKNDFFRPYFTNMVKIQVWVFDRWGLLLKEWDSLDGNWDGYYQGKKCQSDTYVYKIIGLGADGQQSEWVGKVSIVY